jgi:hypothetical protein
MSASRHKPSSLPGSQARRSATTAAGLAAERVALVDRDRARRTSNARTAARRLDRPAPSRGR